MGKTTSITDLRISIELLKVERSAKEQLLKEQLFLVIESYRPFNILEQKLKGLTSPSNMADHILGTFLGLAAGHFSKIIVVGKSANLFRKFAGSILQFGVTKFMVQHTEVLKSAGQFIIQHLSSNKK